ncbi:MAG: hypothetical protein AABZ60_10880 [Planctomycetota bacterium]
MKILIIGDGGREHSLAWKISQSPRVSSILCAPGNPGTARFGKNFAISHPNSIFNLARKEKVDFVIFTSETFSQKELLSWLAKENILVFATAPEVMRLEQSILFAKQFMVQYQIPTSSYRVFSYAEEAKDYLRKDSFPLLLRVEGLNSEQGTFVCDDPLTTRKLIEEILVRRKFGEDIGKQIILEEFLQGLEISMMVLVDGSTLAPFPPTTANRILGKKQKLLSQGLGAIAPCPNLNPDQLKRIEEEILIPTIHGMKTEGLPLRGLFQVRCILSNRGPKATAFKVGFSEPEIQALLPLCRSDFFSHLYAAATGTLSEENIEWSSETVANVVVFSQKKEGPDTCLTELPSSSDPSCMVFFHQIRQKDQQYYFRDGPIFSISAKADSLELAQNTAFQMAEKISFNGAFFSRDLGTAPSV